jgi:hypothetical protein
MNPETNPEIYSAFLKAQRAFRPVIKNSVNPHFKNKYANLSSVIDAVIDALHKNGFALTQHTFPDRDGIRVNTSLLHISGQSLFLGELFIPSPKNDAVSFGSALSYARRYSLLTSLGLAPEDDDGGRATPKDSAIDENVMSDHLEKIAAATTEDELKKVFTLAYKACESDAKWQKVIIAAKNTVKEKL